MKSIVEPFKNFWQFLLVNIIVGIISAFIFGNYPFQSVSHFIIASLWGTLIFLTQSLGHSFIQTQIAKRYSWLEKPLQRFIWTVITVVLYSIVAFVGVQILMNLLVFGEIPDYLLTVNIRNWIVPILISFFISLLAAAYGFFTNLKKSIVEKESLKREMLSFKYEALRNQINPHFMFNSLNVLSDLVYEDQNAAVKFIHEFSDIYRYVLDSREQELVSLEKELLFIEKFISLLKVRFEGKLQIELDLPFQPNDLIVPLSLQLLIENAVKHNEVSKANPLKIKLIRRGDAIHVSNKKQLKNVHEDSKKIGLKNLTQQFNYFTDQEIKINDTASNFEVIVPVLKQD